MTLLREIQAAATDGDVGISTVLRKAKILGARLRNPEFESWVDRELNGYEEGSTLPAYRKIAVIAHATLSDGYRVWNNAPIMTSFLPSELKDWGDVHYVRGPISAIASLAADDQKMMLEAPWPQELAVTYGAKGYPGWNCIGARQILNRSALVGIIETVRNRILEFALQIEIAAPEAGEAPAGKSAPIPQETVTHIYQTYVVGDSNNIATGGSNVAQRSNTGIKPGDLKCLLASLRGLGIPNDQVDDLKEAVESGLDRKAAIESWLGKLAISATTGAVNTAVGFAAKLVSQYLGLDGS
jgi:hypothetical protein